MRRTRRRISQKCTFGNSGTPVRRTGRRISRQELWDSSAQNKTSEISKTTLPGILRLLCADQNVGNLKKCTFRISRTLLRRPKRRKSRKLHFQEFWDSCAQNNTSEISKNVLAEILGFLCAEQNVVHLKTCTLPCGFSASGTLPKFCVVRKYAIQGVMMPLWMPMLMMTLWMPMSMILMMKTINC